MWCDEKTDAYSRVAFVVPSAFLEHATVKKWKSKIILDTPRNYGTMSSWVFQKVKNVVTVATLKVLINNKSFLNFLSYPSLKSTSDTFDCM